jgi:hypothetical protein
MKWFAITSLPDHEDGPLSLTFGKTTCLFANTGREKGMSRRGLARRFWTGPLSAALRKRPGIAYRFTVYTRTLTYFRPGIPERHGSHRPANTRHQP